MILRSTSPFSQNLDSIYDLVQESLGPQLHTRYIHSMDGEYCDNVIESLNNFIQNMLNNENEIRPEAFLDQLRNDFMCTIEDKILQDIFESTLKEFDQLDYFTDTAYVSHAVKEAFIDKVAQCDYMKTKIQAFEEDTDLVSKEYDEELCALELELEKLLPVISKDDPEKRFKLFAILYKSFVVHTSLYKNNDYCQFHKNIKINFKHIDALKFIQKLNAYDLSDINFKHKLSALPSIKNIDLNAYKALEWMPDVIDHIIKTHQYDTSKIKSQLDEIEALLEDYAHQFLSWMILAINENFKYEAEADSNLNVPFVSLFFGLESLSELRSATPLKVNIQDLNDEIYFHPISDFS